MTTMHLFVAPMLTVAAMFMLFGFLRPGEDCGGHCRTCSGSGAGCATKRPPHHD
ncbi:MAG: hypothetical protein ACYC7F_03395 [Gemmatimonadaceae bacterium]